MKNIFFRKLISSLPIARWCRHHLAQIFFIKSVKKMNESNDRRWCSSVGREFNLLVMKKGTRLLITLASEARTKRHNQFIYQLINRKILSQKIRKNSAHDVKLYRMLKYRKTQKYAQGPYKSITHPSKTM